VIDGGPQRRSRAPRTAAGLIAASLLLILVSRTEPVLALQQAAARVVEPLQGMVAGIVRGIGELGEAVVTWDRLRSENDRLREALAAAEQRNAELEEAARQNATLRGLLGLTRSLEMDLLAVRITGRDPSNLSWEVTIDAGSRDGLAPGMPVIAAVGSRGALAGSVVEVSPDGALVRLVVDPRASVVGVDQRTRALGLVQGQLGGQLVMVQVPVSDDAAIGDTIVSAGLALIGSDADPDLRSSYPGGLLIGVVQAIEPDANGLTRTLFVRPALDLPRLERLLVVRYFED